jgi:MSHA biogenesis protein MshN
VAQAELERTMSLLNQVLRDLDQRHAPGAPAAVKVASSRSVAPSAGQRVSRWGLGLVATLAAIVAGGWAQGSLRWPVKAADTPVAVAPVAQVVAAPVPAAVTPVPAAVTPTPVVMTPVTVAPTPVVANAPAALQVAIAAPTVRRQPAAPKPMSDTPQAVSSNPNSTPEPRIDMRAAARSPQERAETHYQRGVTTHQAGQINDSAAAFAAALREEPRHVGARVAQAGLLIGQSRPDEAMALLKEGIALTPAQPQLALMLARMQAERQDWPTAADTLKAASAHATDNPEFHGLHAAILQRAGRHGDAVEKYSQALRLAPGRSVWWMGLAISLEEMGQAETARAAFHRAKTIGLPEGAAAYVDARLKQLG